MSVGVERRGRGGGCGSVLVAAADRIEDVGVVRASAGDALRYLDGTRNRRPDDQEHRHDHDDSRLSGVHRPAHHARDHEQYFPAGQEAPEHGATIDTLGQERHRDELPDHEATCTGERHDPCVHVTQCLQTDLAADHDEEDGEHDGSVGLKELLELVFRVAFVAEVREHDGGEERAASIHARQHRQPPALSHHTEQRGAREAEEDGERLLARKPRDELGDVWCEPSSCNECESHEDEVLGHEDGHESAVHIPVRCGRALPRRQGRETEDVVDGGDGQDDLRRFG